MSSEKYSSSTSSSSEATSNSNTSSDTDSDKKKDKERKRAMRLSSVLGARNTRSAKKRRRDRIFVRKIIQETVKGLEDYSQIMDGIVSLLHDYAAEEDMRFNWESMKARLCRTKRGFKQAFGVNVESMDKIVTLLTPFIDEKGRRDTNSEYIETVNIIQMSLRYLRGSRVSDIARESKVPNTTFYDCLRVFVAAVHKCPDLELKLPQTVEELEEARKGFRKVSYRGLMIGINQAIAKSMSKKGNEGEDQKSNNCTDPSRKNQQAKPHDS
eukprot:Nk52_evm10s2604 gene=Nk52_evmTU10s2604